MLPTSRTTASRLLTPHSRCPIFQMGSIFMLPFCTLKIRPWMYSLWENLSKFIGRRQTCRLLWIPSSAALPAPPIKHCLWRRAAHSRIVTSDLPPGNTSINFKAFVEIVRWDEASTRALTAWSNMERFIGRKLGQFLLREVDVGPC